VVVARLGWRARRTNAGPKAFAAKLGFGFSLAVASALLLGNSLAALVAGSPFALCALLEATLGFCVGCRIYQVWRHLGWRSGWYDSPVSRGFIPRAPTPPR
jgi:cytochrome c biogenesis factor